MTFANLILLQGEGVAIGTILLLFFLFFIGLVLLIIAIKTIKIVPQATVMLVERLGRFNRVGASGLNILVPSLETARGAYWTDTRPGLPSNDVRERYLYLPPQPVITRAIASIYIGSVVYR